MEIGDDEWFETEGRPALSRELFESVALSGEEFVEFLTLPAYERLEECRTFSPPPELEGMLSYLRRHLRLLDYANVRSDNFPVPPTETAAEDVAARRAARPRRRALFGSFDASDRVVFSRPRRWAVCAAR